MERWHRALRVEGVGGGSGELGGCGWKWKIRDKNQTIKEFVGGEKRQIEAERQKEAGRETKFTERKQRQMKVGWGGVGGVYARGVDEMEMEPEIGRYPSVSVH